MGSLGPNTQEVPNKRLFNELMRAGLPLPGNHENPMLWPPDVKNRLTGKDPDAGKD